MGISVLADVKIYVYFEDLRTRVTETVQAQPYEWVELMADIGGVASLWLGLSVLGVLEIVHMLVELSVVGFSKCCGKGDHSVTPVKPFDGSA
ncbi:hypothetical protein BaRGS_00005658 [Batillaria attramentaria]|uniref:Uncharacterized protein n=1 Tax=Batillaria attramentaria TaxID=370345 RepID=A0ABD0LUQ6_9CAEN